MNTVIALAALAAAQPAAPSADTDPWRIGQVTVEGRGDTIVEVIDVAYTADPTKTGVMLMCLDGEITARFATKPIDLMDQIEGFMQQARRVEVRFFVNDELVDESTWAHFRMDRMVQPVKNSLAAKTFNAVVRGDDIAFAVRRKRTEVYLPEASPNFGRFAKTCRSSGLE